MQGKFLYMQGKCPNLGVKTPKIRHICPKLVLFGHILAYFNTRYQKFVHRCRKFSPRPKYSVPWYRISYFCAEMPVFGVEIRLIQGKTTIFAYKTAYLHQYQCILLAIVVDLVLECRIQYLVTEFSLLCLECRKISSG